jgi:hypothetical protein
MIIHYDSFDDKFLIGDESRWKCELTSREFFQLEHIFELRFARSDIVNYLCQQEEEKMISNEWLDGPGFTLDTKKYPPHVLHELSERVVDRRLDDLDYEFANEKIIGSILKAYEEEEF